MSTHGIHLVWTCYGTWLPGDDRGHWSPLFDFYGHLVRSGQRLNPPDSATRRHVARLMKERPRVLDGREIGIVADSVGAQLAPGMPGASWRIRAAALEPTHVHLLIDPLRDDVGKVAGRLKSTSSSAVLQLPQNTGCHRVWTSGYWKVFLFDEAGVHAVRRYIVEHNLRRGLPADPYAWIVPIEET